MPPVYLATACKGRILDETELIEAYLHDEPVGVDFFTDLIEKAVGFAGWRFSVEERKDLVQDVHEKLLTNLQGRYYRGEGMRTYVSRIAKNTCVVYDRIKRRLETADITTMELPDPNPDPLRQLLDVERLRTGEMIFRELDHSCKRLLIMVFIRRLRYRDIAQRLSCSENAIKVRVFRCLQKVKKLRDKIEKRP